MQTTNTIQAAPYPLYKIVIGRTILAAFIALAFDWVAPLLLLVFCVGALPITIIPGRRKQLDVRAAWVKVAIYGIGTIAAFSLLHERRADDQAAADKVIRSLEQYHQVHGAYPPSLSQLVPAFLPGVPRARNSPFVYSPAEPGDYRLTYVDMPPGGSRTFSSKTRGWSQSAE